MENESREKEEDLSDYSDSRGIVRWLLKEHQIASKDEDYQNFLDMGREIVKKYKNYKGKGLGNLSNWFGKGRLTFNVLWSNVQSLKPSLYARLPKTVAERRFKDSDSISRVGCQLIERATSFSLQAEADNFNQVMDGCVEDRLLPGRGTAWSGFEYEYDEIKQVNEAGEESIEELRRALSEKSITQYVFWEDFFHTMERNWADTRMVWKRASLTRQQLVSRYGEIGKKVKLNEFKEDKEKEQSTYASDFFQKAEVYEFWNKDEKKVYEISPGYKEAPLKVTEDKLQLVDFFPCPRPLYATLTNDSLIPTADYRIYCDLADELDIVTRRLASLTDVVRVVGFHAADQDIDMKKLLRLKDGETAPHKFFAVLAEKGGFKGVMDWFPFEKVVEAIVQLSQRQQQLLGQIYEVTGMPDIIRGNSDPRDSATVQQIKGQWAVLRIQKKQADVQRFAKELIARKAEIIFSHFSDQTIALMTGLQQMPADDQMNFWPALQLLRDDKLRTFRIDIETDSTISVDEEQQRQGLIEAIGAIGQTWNSAFPMIQMRPELMRPMTKTVSAVIRNFRGARDLEQSWEQALDEIETNMEAEMSAPPPEDPAMIKEQAKIELAQRDMQLKESKAMHDAQMKEMTAQSKAALDNLRMQQEMMLKTIESRADLNLQAEKIRGELAIKAKEAESADNINTIKALKEENQKKMQGTNVFLRPPSKKTKKVARLINPTTGEERIGIVEEEEVEDAVQ